MKRVSWRTPLGSLIGAGLYGKGDFAKVVIYCHGFPGSSVEGTVLVNDLGPEVTILAPDRPGYGQSERIHRRNIIDFPKLILGAIEQFNISSFAVIALSGGAPYALALASYFGQKVNSLTIISGMGEVNLNSNFSGMILPNRLLLKTGCLWPILALPSIACLATWWRYRPIDMLRWYKLFLPSADRSSLDRPEIQQMLIADVSYALVNGIAGVVDDFVSLVKPWEIRYQNICCPVTILHGDKDCYVPLQFARATAQSISTASANQANSGGDSVKVIAGGGHFMLADCLPEIARSVVFANSSR